MAAVSQPVARQPAPVKAAPKPVLTALDRLAGRQWVRGDRPVDYLPSEVTQCDRDDDALVCFSKVLTRVTGTQTVQYRVKSFVRTDKDSFVISYRNLVLDVTDSQEPEDQPLDGIGRLPIRGRLIETIATIEDDHEMTAIASNTNDSRRAPLGQPIPGEGEELPPLPRVAAI